MTSRYSSPPCAQLDTRYPREETERSGWSRPAYLLFSQMDLSYREATEETDDHRNPTAQRRAAVEDYQRAGPYPEPRPLNLDPGVLELGKFLLATTKDQAHRIYLRDGIFAEVTLRFQDGAFVPWEWTYADYRLPEVRAFLGEARDYYRVRLREA